MLCSRSLRFRELIKGDTPEAKARKIIITDHPIGTVARMCALFAGIEYDERFEHWPKEPMPESRRQRIFGLGSKSKDGQGDKPRLPYIPETHPVTLLDNIIADHRFTLEWQVKDFEREIRLAFRRRLQNSPEKFWCGEAFLPVMVNRLYKKFAGPEPPIDLRGIFMDELLAAARRLGIRRILSMYTLIEEFPGFAEEVIRLQLYRAEKKDERLEAMEARVKEFEGMVDELVGEQE